MGTYELVIFNKGQAYFPSVIEPIEFESIRTGGPSKLTFTVVKGQMLNFQEGNPVRLKYNGRNVFYGFVFTKSRDREHHIKVTAYDQIRYLKFKDTLVFENKTATQYIRHIANINPSLNLGKLANTGYVIPSRIEDNTSYLDMIKTALDTTALYTGKMYILQDNFGKLELLDIDKLVVNNFIISNENFENFDYESTIDDDVYNQIKLVHENEETGKRDVYIAKDTHNINRWGLLQFFDTIDEHENGRVKANTLLKLHNKKKRKLTIKEIRGNLDVKAGYRVMVMLNVGDLIVQNYLIVDSVKHKFKESEHKMDITFIGGGFSV